MLISIHPRKIGLINHLEIYIFLCGLFHLLPQSIMDLDSFLF